MKTYRILSIDAWADCCGCECEENKPTCWVWNNWHHVGDIEKIPENDEGIIEMMIEEGFLDPKAKGGVHVEDDQFNLVIKDNENEMPIFAIEYGNKI